MNNGTRDTAVVPNAKQGLTHPVAPDVVRFALPIVNVYFIGAPGAGDRNWVLVDAGLPGFANQIAKAVAERFGPGARPAAIVMTHGHFDHTGVLRELADRWDVPVYAHPLELPYLTGRSPYPPADPGVGGGAMALFSWMYPRGPIDVGERARSLPANGSVPHLPDWQAIHTPGHSPGHVSLWREADRTLVAGDAFVTTKQESAVAAFTKPQVVHGPPMYYTPDWEAAHRSVNTLAALHPAVAATGHGVPMYGTEMNEALTALAHDFDNRAVPDHGRYVDQAAITDERGIVSVPPPKNPLARPLVTFVAAALAGAAVAVMQRRKQHTT